MTISNQKIYFLCYDIYGIGGTVRTIINISNYLQENGYNINIISIRQTHDKPKLKLSSNVTIIPLQDFRKKKVDEKILSLLHRKILQKFPTTIFHSDEDLYNRFTYYSDYTINKALSIIEDGAIVISTMSSLNIYLAKNKSKLTKNILIGQEHKLLAVHSKSLQNEIKKSYNKLDALMVLTNSDALTYMEFISKNKILIQPNSTLIPKSTSTLNEKRIISIGRLHKVKEYDKLIMAFSLVHKKYPDWRLDIYGNGYERQNLEPLIDKLQLNKYITLHQEINDITPVMEKASIFALTSKYEGFGMVIIEANAHGLPVVAFNVLNGPSELISHDNGILVEYPDIQKFANALNMLIQNTEKRKILGSNGREYIKRTFSTDRIGKLFIENITKVTKS